MRPKNFTFFLGFLAWFLVAVFIKIAVAGTLSCTLSTTCTSTVVLKMSSSTNAHAELPNQSNYSQLVCCTGVLGLSNSCSGSYQEVLGLSSSTNAHVETNTNSNYSTSSCLSVSAGSVTVAYQSSNCSGYDTTLASINNTTNSHVGAPATYSTKVCATASSGALSVDIVDAGGLAVTSPSITMNTSTISLSYQTVTGVLGIASQKIRVDNPTGNSRWTLSLAASTSTASWHASLGDYDFNDPTANANDGSDPDSWGGQMTIDPSGATLIAKSGCNNTGLSKGSATGFSQGITNDITLITAGSSAGTSCYWDLINIGVSQTIPKEQVPTNYAINMILSVVAN